MAQSGCPGFQDSEPLARGQSSSLWDVFRQYPKMNTRRHKMDTLEAPSGFEPLHKGFADLSLSHLGTAPHMRSFPANRNRTRLQE